MMVTTQKRRSANGPGNSDNDSLLGVDGSRDLFSYDQTAAEETEGAPRTTGEKVITSSGIYGQIESVSEDTVVLKVESGATIRVAKSTVIAKQAK